MGCYERLEPSHYAGQAAPAAPIILPTRSGPAGRPMDSRPVQTSAPSQLELAGRLRRRRTKPRRPKTRSGGQVSPAPPKNGGVGRPLRRALGWPTGLQALLHAAATPTRQEFEFGKTKVNLAHRTTPYRPFICFYGGLTITLVSATAAPRACGGGRTASCVACPRA